MADKTYRMTVTLSDGTSINAGTFVAQQGAKGDTGSKGNTGATGASGIGWEHGTADPISTPTVAGTLYLNTTTGEVWAVNSSLAWVDTGATMKGATGATGPKVSSASITEVV